MSGKNNPYSKDGESVRDFLDDFERRTFDRFEQRRQDRREERVAQATAEFQETTESAQGSPHGVDAASWEEAADGARDDVEAWFKEKQEWRRQFREAYAETLVMDEAEDGGGGGSRL
ncbi:hypothetical protein [Natrinema sp. 1APR25-10V2]|uniref:hypothetical protein n=1 Tax=Natrinema sp. 1APR25-10V2 TaxID=2951081 RepID=UPI0028761412|nr:hypothetical protein [Natrinema sp. 1APR25-10V2]MDS0477983.1 hypothetical protein [Natrinema sp. 1APR25-10V2]